MASSKDHETGRVCETAGCGGALRDNIVHFGEGLPWNALTLANAKVRCCRARADTKFVCVCVCVPQGVFVCVCGCLYACLCLK